MEGLPQGRTDFRHLALILWSVLQHLWEKNYRKLQEALKGPWNTQAYLYKEPADCCIVNADIHWTLLQVFNSFCWCSSPPPSIPLFTRMPNTETGGSLHPLTAQRHCIMYHCVQTMLPTFKSEDLSQNCLKHCSFLTSKFKVEEEVQNKKKYSNP